MAIVESASNIGSGAGVFKQKTGTDLELRSLQGIQGLEATVLGDEVTLGYEAVENAASTNVTADNTELDASYALGIPESNSGSNIGEGVGVFESKVLNTLRFRTLVGRGGVDVVNSGDEIVVGFIDVVSSDSDLITADATTIDASENRGVPQSNTASNIGNGVGVYDSKNIADLRFKTLAGRGGVQVIDDGEEIKIGFLNVTTAASIDETADGTLLDSSDFSEIPESNDGRNLGSGIGLFKDKDGSFLQYKSVVAGANIEIEAGENSITINAPDPTSASNQGAGAKIFKQKTDNDLEFRSLVGGKNVLLTEAADTVTIEAPDPTTGSNTGMGADVFKEKTGDSLVFRRLGAGENVNVFQDGDTVTVSADSPTTATNLGGSGLFSGKIDDVLEFKGLEAGSNITLTDTGNTVRITSTGGGNPSTSPWFNVLSYGAKNDGSDGVATTQAFKSAIAAISSTSSSGVLYIPAGTYNLIERLDVNNGRPITILGDGYGVSILRWTSSGGIRVTDPTHSSTVKGLAFTSTAGNAGTALEILGSFIHGTVEIGCSLQDLWFTGTPGSNGYWSQAVRISECPQSSLENIQVDGSSGGAQNGVFTDVALEIHSVSSATQYRMTGLQFLWVNVGIRATGGGSTGSVEGFHLTNSDFVACNIGIRTDELGSGAGRAPNGIQIMNCHMACVEYCVLGPIEQSIISNNLFYTRSGANNSIIFVDDESFGASSFNIFSSNIFVNTGSSPGDPSQPVFGITLGQNVANSVVKDNVFQMSGGSGKSAIQFGGGSLNGRMQSGNIVYGDYPLYIGP